MCAAPAPPAFVGCISGLDNTPAPTRLRNWYHGEVQRHRLDVTVTRPDLDRRQRDGLIAGAFHEDPISARTLVSGAEQLDTARRIDLRRPETINERSLADRPLRAVGDVLPRTGLQGAHRDGRLNVERAGARIGAAHE